MHHVPLSKIEHVRSLIQHSDPIGVASQTPQEALIIQAEVLREEGTEIPPLTKRALEEGFMELSKQEIRRFEQTSWVFLHSDTEKIISFIGENLKPLPCSRPLGQPSEPNRMILLDRYQDPDIIISKNRNEPDAQLIVQVLWPIYGNLHINQFLKKVISEQETEGTKMLAG